MLFLRDALLFRTNMHPFVYSIFGFHDSIEEDLRLGSAEFSVPY
jgi:hypothetical protein